MKKILVLKRTTGFLIAAIVMLTICVSAADYRMIEPPVKAGDTFKNFKVKTTEGQSYDLYLELKEKELAFIVIWFANCEFTGVILSCTQSISHQYEDRVSFIAVNPFDDNKAIKKHNESRGFTTPSAKYINAKKWTDDSYPWILLVHKDGTVLYSDFGSAMTPGQLTDILDAGLSISDEEKANLNGRNMTIQRNHPYSSLSDEDRLRQETLLKSYYTVYNYGDNMKLIFEGEGITRIIVDENADLLQRLENVGEYFIVPDTETIQVTIETSKGFKDKNAEIETMETDFSGSYIMFNEARKNKNKYSFELEMRHGRRYIVYEDTGVGLAVRNNIGFIPFISEDDAQKYFDKCTEKYGFEFPWHVVAYDDGNSN